MKVDDIMQVVLKLLVGDALTGCPYHALLYAIDRPLTLANQSNKSNVKIFNKSLPNMQALHRTNYSQILEITNAS